MARNKNAPESTNKSAKAGQKKDESFQACPEVQRIIPLAGGQYAYVLDPRDGRTHRVAVTSEKWDQLIGELLDTSHGPRILKELERLGWVGSAV